MLPKPLGLPTSGFGEIYALLAIRPHLVAMALNSRAVALTWLPWLSIPEPWLSIPEPLALMCKPWLKSIASRAYREEAVEC